MNAVDLADPCLGNRLRRDQNGNHTHLLGGGDIPYSVIQQQVVRGVIIADDPHGFQESFRLGFAIRFHIIHINDALEEISHSQGIQYAVGVVAVGIRQDVLLTGESCQCFL